MKRILLLVLFAIGVSWSAAFAGERGTPDEAKAMAEKAAAYLKANGPEKAFPVFDAKDGGFVDRDLYVYVYDAKGTVVAHGTNPALIGKVMLDFKDVDGKAFIRESEAVKDTGWVDYKWQNPVTKTIEAKKTYIIRVGEYLVGVGAYAN